MNKFKNTENSLIHPTAIIAANAKIGENVSIGAYCVIGDNVELDRNVTLKSHVVIEGQTKVGEGTTIYPFASIGHKPQDLKFQGEASRVIIGKNNDIREYVTISPGTKGGGLETVIGDNCLFMISVHIAHDCIVGNNVILANNVTFAGHVKVGDFAVVGGLSAVHQFVRIGHNAMIGGMSGIENDVIPFGQANGERANLTGLNLVGLKRGNFSKDEINALRNAYKLLFVNDDSTFDKRIEKIASQFKESENVKKVIEFLKNDTSRAICQPKKIKNSN